MKSRLTLLLVAVGISLSSSVALAQNAYDTPYLNRPVLKYFQGQELGEIMEQDSQMYDRIRYYFTRSFEVSLNNCDQCPIDWNDFFNRELFDIVQVENQRKANTDHTIQFQNGKYEIRLLSETIVLNEMGGMLPSDLIKYTLERQLPGWVDTGNGQKDYEMYKRKVMRWARDFPEEYRQITSTTGILKVPVEEFLSFSEARKNAVFTNPGGYIIID